MRFVLLITLFANAPTFAFAKEKVQETDLSSTSSPGPEEAAPPKWSGKENFSDNRTKVKDLVNSLLTAPEVAPASNEASDVTR